MLYLFVVYPIFIMTVPLVHACIISNGTLYGVSYLHVALLLSMTGIPGFARVLHPDYPESIIRVRSQTIWDSKII